MTTILYPTNFPPQTNPVIDKTGNMTIPGTNFWKALWLRTGGGTGITYTTANTLTSAGTTQADAFPLAADWNAITLSNVSGLSGVVLPALVGGQSITVFNNSANQVKLYPPVGGNLNILSVPFATNIPYTLTVPDALILYYFSDTDIVGI